MKQVHMHEIQFWTIKEIDQVTRASANIFLLSDHYEREIFYDIFQKKNYYSFSFEWQRMNDRLKRLMLFVCCRKYIKIIRSSFLFSCMQFQKKKQFSKFIVDVNNPFNKTFVILYATTIPTPTIFEPLFLYSLFLLAV